MDGIHYRISLVKGRFTNYIIKKAQELELSCGQPRVLEYLAEHDGCTQSAICEAWELDRSTVAGLVKRMERDGLVVCEPSQKDKRKKRIWITPKGAGLWSDMKKQLDLLDEAAFYGFSAEETETFCMLLNRMYENLKSLDGDAPEKEQNPYL